MTSINRLSAIQSGYTIKVTTLVANGNWQKAIASNPNRWALSLGGDGVTGDVFPGGQPSTGNGIAITANQNLLYFHFKDNPVLTTSEWWVKAFAGNVVYFIEEIFTG